MVVSCLYKSHWWLKFLFLGFSFLITFNNVQINASINFSSKNCCFRLTQENSKLKYSHTQSFSGWAQRSIVKGSDDDSLKIGGADEIISYAEAPYVDSTVIANSTTVRFLTDHFISVNNGTLSVIGNAGISGNTTLKGKAFLQSPIDLQWGTLNLDGDLILSSGTTIESSGYIHANSHAIILGGDLQIPSGITLTFTSDGIFDGQGHTINIGNRSQLLIDRTASVTLRNLTIKNSVNTIAAPAIKTTNWNAKLTLENVTFALNDDWMFSDGQMFVYSDVKWTGSSQFIYRSPRKSYIMPHSQLYFGQGTSFYYDTNNSSTNDISNNKDLIVLKDSTSGLFFDNCTLRTTHTGMRMTKGKVFFDNKVTLSSAFSKTLSGTIDTAYSTQSLGAQAAAWHPDGQHITVGTFGHERIYKWDGSSLNLIHVTEFADDGLDSSKSAAWSPNGKYLFIGNDGQTNKLYRWDTTSTPTLTHVANTAESESTYGVDWHPSGQFIAVASGGSGGSISNRVYKWDGSSLTLIDSTTETDSSTEAKWSPDGKYLAITNDSSTANRIYSWDGSTLTLVYSTNDTDNSNSQWWSPDGTYLAVGNASAASKIYKWNGSTLRPITTLPATGQASWGISWSPDGQFIAETNWAGGNRIYKWNGDSVTYVASTDAGSGGLGHKNQTIPLVWSLDGKYLAAINWNEPVRIYTLYYPFEEPNQSFTQSIIFGNSSQGSDYDADVCLLAGARVELDGKANFDSLSKLDFADKSASLVVANNSSRLKVGTIATANTFDTQSIVTANENVRAWFSDDIIFGQSSGDRTPSLETRELESDLVVPDGTTLIFDQDTLLDGRGHSLILGHRAQILIDGTATLTLCNLAVKNSLNTIAAPVIKTTNWNAKLVLDNVNFTLNDDFMFRDGQMFVYNDVKWTGSSQFIYRSPRQSYIMPHSQLYFGPGTSFYYDTNNTASVDSIKINNDVATNKDLILLKDKTSSLFFDNCTLQTTHTGMRITKGKVFFDNKVTLSSGLTQKISSLTSVASIDFGASNGVSELDWSPDSRYLAVAGINGSEDLTIYEFSNSSFTKKYATFFGDSLGRTTWNKNGRYLAVGAMFGAGSEFLKIFEWKNETLYEKVATETSRVWGLDWHPSGNFLAVGDQDSTDQLKIFEWNDTSLTQIATDNYPVKKQATACRWNPAGNILAAGGGYDLILYSWDNSSLTITTSLFISGTEAEAVRELSWSPDGRFLAAASRGGSYGNDLLVYEIVDGNLILLDKKDFAVAAYAVTWSPNGRYLSVGGQNTTLDFIIYEWDGNSLTSTFTRDFGTYNISTKWSFDNNYIAVGGLNSSNDVVAYKIDYSFDPTPQAFTQSIIFGNSSQGSDYDADVCLLSGARVELDGKANFDSLNKLDFADKSASLVLDSANGSRLNVGTINDLNGWYQQSIVSSSGDEGSWLSDGSVVGFESGDTSAPTHLLYNNSNAIITVAPYVVSNSGRISSLETRADLDEIMIRANSAYTNLLDEFIVSNSGRISSLETRADLDEIMIRANSAYTTNLDNFILDNSNAQLFMSEHFISVNDGRLSVIGNTGISGNTTLKGKAFLHSPIDLQWGTLNLDGDLILSSDSTIESSGYIHANSNAIVLGGDLDIPAGIVLTFTSDAIIDGQGHTINFGNRAQFQIDRTATLTLRNLIVKNSVNPVGAPPIKTTNWNAKLALENVTFALNDDFMFSHGQMYVYNDVHWTGSSQFIYRSPRQSYIMPHSQLYFDPNTTFYYDTNNSASVDNIKTNNDVGTNKDLIILKDKTSTLFFDNCTLKTTHTGLRLTKGKVFFDNKVTLSSGFTRLLDSTSRIASGVNFGTGSDATRSIAWSPDGRFLAVGNNSAQNVVYPFDGTSFGTGINFGTGSDATLSIAWSPDGRFLAVGNDGAQNVTYPFDGTSFGAGINFGTGGDSTKDMRWSPNGRFLAVGNILQNVVYPFDGTSFETGINFGTGNDNTYSIAWRPDGKFIAVGNSVGQDVAYPFNGTSFGTGINFGTGSDTNQDVKWSPDGKFLAVGNWSQQNVAYPFDGTSFSAGINFGTGSDKTTSIAWSPDGKFLAVGNSSSSQNVVYPFNGTSFDSGINFGTGSDSTESIAWSTDGKFLSAGNDGSQNVVYPINYSYDPIQQAFTQSIIFGNSSQGADYDADVCLLAGARVELDGKANFDSLSKLDFADKSASLVLDSANGSRLNIGIINDLNGWYQQSIVSSSGDEGSWLSDGSVVGFESGDASAPTHLLYNNSNAIMTVAPYIVSNSGRINSLKTRATLDEIMIRANSAYTNLLDEFIVSNSGKIQSIENRGTNWDGYIRSNSGQISSLETRATLDEIMIRANSAYTNLLDEFIVSNSGKIQSLETRGADWDGYIRSNSGQISSLETRATLDEIMIRANSAYTTNLDNFILDNSNAQLFMSEHFISVNDGRLSVIGNTGISGNTTLKSKAFLQSPIDLQWGTLNLDGDLILSSDSTIESSGYIHANSNAIVLGGDLDIPAGIVLTFTSDAIIDGQGHTINFGNRAQFQVDNTATLTLRNLIIKNSVNPIAAPPIKTTNWKAKLALENVTFALNDDFMFSNGELYIYNDVKWTGTSKFIYRSPRQSYIMPHSQLYFDQGTTFYYDTASSATVDNIRTNNDIGTNKDLIVLKDKTSSLFFDNCTLKTTHTGLRLTKGKVFFDNKVTLSSGFTRLLDAASRISSDINFGPSNGNTLSIAWNPDGRFLAVGNAGQNVVYPFDGTSFGAGIDFGSLTNTTRSLSWSPDGRFIALGNDATQNVIYPFDGTSFGTGINFGTGSDVSYSVAWSPDGKFIAVGNHSAQNVVYPFDGTSIGAGINFGTGSDFTYSVAWSPDGRFLAVGNNFGQNVAYPFDGASFGSGINFGTGSDTTRTIAWSPDGRFIALGNPGGQNVVYPFDEISFGRVINIDTNGTVSIVWSPDGKFLAMGNSVQNVVYQFDGTSFGTGINFGGSVNTNSVSWSPDGRFIAVGNGSSKQSATYPINYGYDPIQQAFSQSIIFGNSSQGTDYDADICLLSGSRVELDGKANLDSLSKLDFSDKSASLVLDSANGSRLNVGTINDLNGWYQQSIVSASGDEGSWLSDGSVVGFESGDTFAPTHLLYNNSNAVINIETQSTLNEQMIRSNSAYTNNLDNIIFANSTAQLFMSEHFISINDGKLSVIGNTGISGNTTLKGKAFLHCPIDLQWGTLNLDVDLILSSDSTIESSGYIHANSNAIVLGGDLDITAGVKITFTSDAIIDGQGHTINFGNRAQFQVDKTATLTLRNLIIKNSVNPIAEPVVKTTNWKAKLALENVTFALNDNFMFSHGELYIYNDVKWTGTSKFIYRSPRQSYIMPHSQLYFDHGTTFYYDTASSATVDNIKTNNDITTNKDLIVLRDETSSLFFDNCTLQTTHTGLRLTKGKVFFDNKVTLSSGFTRLLDSTSRIGSDINFGTGIDNTNFLAWSPNGRFLAVGNSSAQNVVYPFNGASFGSGVNFGTGSDVTKSLAWSPNGRFLAVGNLLEQNAIYPFNGTSFEAGINFGTGSDNSYSVAWSPDGRFLAAGNYNAQNVVYPFDGTSFGSGINFGTGSDSTESIAWSPDGRFLAVGNDFEQNAVYPFDGTSFGTVINFGTGTDKTKSLAWSRDGRFIAVGNADAQNSVVYPFDGTSFGTGINFGPSSDTVASVSWSPDGKFIAMGTSVTGEQNVIYPFYGTSFGSGINFGTGIDTTKSVAWSHDGRFIAVGNSSSEQNVVYPINYGYDPTAQAFSQSIIFGNSYYDNVSTSSLDVFLLAGSRVEIDGMANMDSINKLDFSDKSGSFVLNSDNSRLKTGSITQTKGWYQQSIVAASGNEGTWLSNNTIYGDDAGDTGAPTHLIYNNSTANIASSNNNFISINDGTLSVIGSAGISGDTTLQGKAFLQSPIDLQWGTLNLDGDLILSSDSSFESSGYIHANSHAIVLGGDLDIPNEIKITFTSDAIIDGQGHTINFGNWAQFQVDRTATLTLRNLTIKNSVNGIAASPIKTTNWHAGLALENVNFALNDDLMFSTGQLYIYNDVVISGTSQFIYRSPRQSYIMPHSCLHFDPKTTFYYDTANSSTSGHINLSVDNTTNKDLIVLKDETSNLIFNSCTLKTTHTGLRLTKGKVFFDNKVTMSSNLTRMIDSSSRITTIDTGVSLGSAGAAWSHDGRYLYITRNGGADKLYSWDGSSLTLLATTSETDTSKNVSWSFDDRYIAVASSTSGNRIYTWDGTTLTLIHTATVGDENSFTVDWSPDGKYLAVGNGGDLSSTANRIYSWNGTTLTSVDTTTETDPTRSFHWSPDGKHLFAANQSGVNRLYSWDGTTMTLEDSTSNSYASQYGQWSPDGKYIAVANNGLNEIYMLVNSKLRFITQSGSSLNGQTVAWSPDGHYLVFGYWNASSKLLRWDGTSLTSIANLSINDNTLTVPWSPDGRFIFEGFFSATNHRIHQINYGYDPAAQAFSQSIIFGNSSQGSSYDLGVYLLGSARVEVDGYVWYDAAS